MVFVIWSRSCSNQFKRGMEFPQGIWNLGKKDFRYSWPLEKVRFLNKNLRLFRISNLKKRSLSSGQGVVQINSNSAWSILRVYKN